MGRTLVVSLPNDIQEKSNPAGTNLDILCKSMLLQLEETGRWPIVVSVPNGPVPKKPNILYWDTMNNDKHGSYVLVVEMKNGHSFVRDVSEQVQRLESYSAWNSRAKFTVVMIGDTSDNVSNTVSDIMQVFWEHDIVNVVVLYVIGPKIDIYKSLPYKLAYRCCKNSHVIQKVGLWTTNSLVTPPFFKEIPRNLNGCILKTSTISFEPFVFFKNSKTLDGCDVRMSRALSQALNLTLNYTVSFDFERKGRLYPNGTWSGTRGDVIYGRADLTFGFVLRDFLDHLVFDDSIKYFSDTLNWIVAKAERYPRWLSTVRVFDPMLWLALIASIPINALILNLLSCEGHERSWSYVYSCLNSWGSLLSVSVPQLPHSTPLRFYFLSWLTVSFAINTVYQAYFISFIIDPGRRHQIDDEDEMFRSKPTFVISAMIDKYFPEEFVARWKPRIPCRPLQCRNAVVNEDNYVTIGVKSYTLYFCEDLAIRGVKHGMFQFSESIHETGAYLLFSKGTPLLDRVNDILQHLKEGGFIEKWFMDMLIEKRIKVGVRGITTLADEYCALNLTHLQSAFVMLGFGVSLSLVVLVVEYLLS